MRSSNSFLNTLQAVTEELEYLWAIKMLCEPSSGLRRYSNSQLKQKIQEAFNKNEEFAGKYQQLCKTIESCDDPKSEAINVQLKSIIDKVESKKLQLQSKIVNLNQLQQLIQQALEAGVKTEQSLNELIIKEKAILGEIKRANEQQQPLILSNEDIIGKEASTLRGLLIKANKANQEAKKKQDEYNEKASEYTQLDMHKEELLKKLKQLKAIQIEDPRQLHLLDNQIRESEKNLEQLEADLESKKAERLKANKLYQIDLRESGSVLKLVEKKKSKLREKAKEPFNSACEFLGLFLRRIKLLVYQQELANEIYQLAGKRSVYQMQVAKCLLIHSANPMFSIPHKGSPLQRAIKHNNIAMALLFINSSRYAINIYPTNVGVVSLLEYSALRGYVEITTVLLRYKASISSEFPGEQSNKMVEAHHKHIFQKLVDAYINSVIAEQKQAGKRRQFGSFHALIESPSDMEPRLSIKSENLLSVAIAFINVSPYLLSYAQDTVKQIWQTVINKGAIELFWQLINKKVLLANKGREKRKLSPHKKQGVVNSEIQQEFQEIYNQCLRRGQLKLAHIVIRHAIDFLSFSKHNLTLEYLQAVINSHSLGLPLGPVVTTPSFYSEYILQGSAKEYSTNFQKGVLANSSAVQTMIDYFSQGPVDRRLRVKQSIINLEEANQLTNWLVRFDCPIAKLSLEACVFVQKKYADKFFSAVVRNTSLLELVIDNCQISKEPMDEYYGVLLEKGNFRNLRLLNTNLTSDGLKKVLGLVSKNKRLRHLYISSKTMQNLGNFLIVHLFGQQFSGLISLQLGSKRYEFKENQSRVDNFYKELYQSANQIEESFMQRDRYYNLLLLQCNSEGEIIPTAIQRYLQTNKNTVRALMKFSEKNEWSYRLVEFNEDKRGSASYIQKHLIRPVTHIFSRLRFLQLSSHSQYTDDELKKYVIAVSRRENEVLYNLIISQGFSIKQSVNLRELLDQMITLLDEEGLSLTESLPFNKESLLAKKIRTNSILIPLLLQLSSHQELLYQDIESKEQTILHQVGKVGRQELKRDYLSLISRRLRSNVFLDSQQMKQIAVRLVYAICRNDHKIFGRLFNPLKPYKKGVQLALLLVWKYEYSELSEEKKEKIPDNFIVTYCREMANLFFANEDDDSLSSFFPVAVEMLSDAQKMQVLESARAWFLFSARWIIGVVCSDEELITDINNRLFNGSFDNYGSRLKRASVTLSQFRLWLKQGCPQTKKLRTLSESVSEAEMEEALRENRAQNPLPLSVLRIFISLRPLSDNETFIRMLAGYVATHFTESARGKLRFIEARTVFLKALLLVYQFSQKTVLVVPDDLISIFLRLTEAKRSLGSVFSKHKDHLIKYQVKILEELFDLQNEAMRLLNLEVNKGQFMISVKSAAELERFLQQCAWYHEAIVSHQGADSLLRAMEKLTQYSFKKPEKEKSEEGLRSFLNIVCSLTAALDAEVEAYPISTNRRVDRGEKFLIYFKMVIPLVKEQVKFFSKLVIYLPIVVQKKKMELENVNKTAESLVQKALIRRDLFRLTWLQGVSLQLQGKLNQKQIEEEKESKAKQHVQNRKNSLFSASSSISSERGALKSESFLRFERSGNGFNGLSNGSS